VYAGVIVLASPSMATKLATNLPGVTVPPGVIERLERDPHAGVELAYESVELIRASGAFDGVHLVPVTRYREVAARFEPLPA
jgi:hypothetical protein